MLRRTERVKKPGGCYQRIAKGRNSNVHTSDKYLQDSIVTMRGDRFVLPVKSEHKSKIKGFVHDQSATGSTLFIEPVEVLELNNQLRQAIKQVVGEYL